jgi:hypothetical protein
METITKTTPRPKSGVATYAVGKQGR